MPEKQGEGTDRGELLDRFEAPTGQIATFETGELTALCPFDFGGPDFYDLLIRYESAGYAVESKSMKQYLETFRDAEATAEEIADDIATAVEETISPRRLYVRLEQARRGGIEETVEVGDVELRG